MVSAPAAEHAGRGPATWPRDAQFGSMAPGKIGMWIFLISDAFSFAALLAVYGFLRGRAEVWQAADEPPLGVSFTAGLTILLIASSATGVLAWVAAATEQRRQAASLLSLTALGGALFLLGQLQEWWGIWSHGLMREGLVFGRSARASSFYAITGYHGLHVLAGVVYILAVLGQYWRGKAGARQLELLALFWCFVDFVWVFVFSFVYLFP